MTLERRTAEGIFAACAASTSAKRPSDDRNDPVLEKVEELFEGIKKEFYCVFTGLF